MNIRLLKETTFEDYERRLKKVIQDCKQLQENELFVRLINYDRQLLFGCCGKIIRVSQTSVISNRDELSFFESILHFIHYYMWDDGELTIKWQKYSLEDGVFLDVDKSDKDALPYLDYTSSDNDKVVREKEVMWLLDWHEAENQRRIETFKDFDETEPEYEKEFIDYN